MDSAPSYRQYLQRFCLFLGISVFASVVYLSYAKPQHSQTSDATALLYSIEQSQIQVSAGEARSSLPNLVFILTDDQDVVLSGAAHMPKTHELLAQQGVVMENAFVASPLCCPSRSSIMTGRFVHNHKAINNSISGGCSGTYWRAVTEKKTLAVHLQSAGYQTFFAGKYLNQYGRDDAGGTEHVPPGWNKWVGLVGNSVYYNYTLSVDGVKEKHGDDPSKDYLTKVIWERAKEFLDTIDVAPMAGNYVESRDRKEVTQPFFMMMSTPAAHAPFQPEPQYTGNFSDLKAKRTSSFNIENDLTKHWLLRLGEQPLSDDIVDKMDDVFRNRLRTLLTVDDMVADIVSVLEQKNLLDNTYIVFASDNGYHLGQFSMPLDKREPYEFDIKVPLMVRGPGIKQGVTLSHPTVNVDLAPTLLDLAGVPIPEYMDGVSLKSLLLQTTFKNDQMDNVKYTVLEKNDDNDLEENIVNQSEKTRNEYIDIVTLENEEKASRLEGHVDFIVFPDLYKRAILIEHSGEGLEEQKGACSYLGPGVSSCLADYACKCQDSTNNTYSCVRQIQLPIYNVDHGNKQELQEPQRDQSNQTGTMVEERSVLRRIGLGGKFVDAPTSARTQALVKDTVFCMWEDDESFIEYYDLKTDEDQLNNAINDLTAGELDQHKELLATLKSCKGASCYVEGF